MSTNTATPALTRRQAREIERQTGVRPVATIAQAPAPVIEMPTVFDTAEIERNLGEQLASIAPTGILDRPVVSPAFGGRPATVRAARPAALVAQSRRRAVASVAVAASAAAIATTSIVLPAQGADIQPAAHQADLAQGVKDLGQGDQAAKADAAAAAGQVQASTDTATAAPEVAAPAESSSRGDYQVASFSADAVEAATPAASGSASSTGGVSTGTSGSSSPSVSGAGASASTGGVSLGTGNSIVDLASTYVGVIYYSNGASPEAGFDCSGLVQWVYGQNGISMPRTVSAQAAMGTPTSNPQPGDLVVWSDHSHIGIYAGNGMMIDSPDYGRTVQYRAPSWGSWYYVHVG